MLVVRNIVQWDSTCLTCPRSQVSFSVLERRRTEKRKKKGMIGRGREGKGGDVLDRIKVDDLILLK